MEAIKKLRCFLADKAKVYYMNECPPQLRITFTGGEIWPYISAVESEQGAIESEHEEMHSFCKRLEEAANEREDVEIFGVAYTPLPLDADGVPIHVGDRLGNNKRVVRIMFDDDEPSSVLAIDDEQRMSLYYCNEVSHYRKPTPEDVLREFARQFAPEETTLSDQDFDEIIADYAAKLQLKE